MKVKIEDANNLERDIRTGAVVNTSITALEQAKASKQKRMNTDQRLNRVEDTLDEILRLLKG